jgi:hypothetical protein
MMFAAALMAFSSVCTTLPVATEYTLAAEYDPRTGQCLTVEQDADGSVNEYASEEDLGYLVCEAIAHDSGAPGFEYDAESGHCLIADINEDGASDWEEYDIADTELEDYPDVLREAFCRGVDGPCVVLAPVVIAAGES